MLKIHSSSWGRTFAWILSSAGAFAGCSQSTGGDCSGGPAPLERDETTQLSNLERVARDGKITTEECISICSGDPYGGWVECELTYDDALLTNLGGAGGQASVVGGAGGASDPDVSVHCSGLVAEMCAGRRHVSWGDAQLGSGGCAQARWFARAAGNEAASVRSFRALAQELSGTSLGGCFVERLRVAARQEIRHARVMGSHARRRGLTPARRPLGALVARSLLEIALENAREGCVHETFAALVMRHQAEHAQGSQLKREFLEIAIDETAHAELAWRLHEAFLGELEPHEADLVQRELVRAIEALRQATTVEFVTELDGLGLPAGASERQMRLALAEALDARAELLGAAA